MSHIFDALQRSEAEQSGQEPDSFSLAAELLKIAESEAPSLMAEAPAPAPAMRIHDAVMADAGIPQPEIPGARTPKPAAPAPSGPFDQFESLPVSILPGSKLVSVTEKDSLAAEKFRFLAVRLRQLQQGRPLKKVLITSTIPGEGKSMVAANLACTLARKRQQKTLLLDGDLRRPTLARQFGLGKVPGLSEWFQSGTGPMTNIYRLDALGFWFLPAGSAPQNPLELMQSGKISPLMEQLTAWFDWIVIDSPPVLPLADTSVWSRLADGVLLVSRPGITEKQQLQRGIEALDRSKLIGALINSSVNAAHTDYYQRYGPSAVARENQDLKE